MAILAIKGIHCDLRNRLASAAMIALAGVMMIRAENVVFPMKNSGVVDIVKTYGIDKTGKTDVTLLLQKAIDSNNTWRTLYLPNGTYLVSNTVHWKLDPSPTNPGRGPILQGQSRKGTIIRLRDNSGLSGPVLKTGSGVAQCFNRGLHNLTVNTGTGNPSAAGVNWFGNNESIMSNVDIVSADNNGSIGLDLAGGEQGPCMVKKVYIKGFKTGVRCDALNAVTMSHISLANISTVGITNVNNPLYVDSLTATNLGVTVVNNSGIMVVANAYLTGTNSSVPAISNSGTMFCRTITTQGFQRAITSGGTPPTGATIDEFSSGGSKSIIAGSATRTLGVPVRFAPDPDWDPDTNHWANMETVKGGLGVRLSDIVAMQKALDSSSITTILLPWSKQYTFNDTIRVRGATQRIIGTAGQMAGTGAIVVEDGPGASPVVKFERIGLGVPLIVRCSRTVVVEAMEGGYIYGDGTGNLFITDITGYAYIRGPQQKCYMWHYDAEPGEYDNLVISGGRTRIFGWKTEAWGTKVKMTGGALEMLGFLSYNYGAKTGPLISIINSAFSVACMSQTNFDGNPYNQLVHEERNGQIADLSVSGNGGSLNLPLFIGYDQNYVQAKPAAPRSGALADIIRAFGNSGGLRIARANAGASIDIFDIRGRSVRVLHSGASADLAAPGHGMYLVRARSASGAHRQIKAVYAGE